MNVKQFLSYANSFVILAIGLTQNCLHRNEGASQAQDRLESHPIIPATMDCVQNCAYFKFKTVKIGDQG